MFGTPKTKYKDSTQAISEVAGFLVDDRAADKEIPLKQFLDASKLDYSVESLKYVDSYLDEVGRNTDSLSNTDLTTIILRCGAYCGEVIRRNSNRDFHWVGYDEATKLNKQIESFGRSLGLEFVLFSEPDTFWFPLAKVGKYLENGIEDSLYYLATVALQPE